MTNKCIAIANQKGGVGKTTSSVNIAGLLALSGANTLLLDNDPQSNATSVYSPGYSGPSFYEEGTIIATSRPHLQLAPANIGLIDEEHTLSNSDGGDLYLSDRISGLEDNLAYTLIDCPPSINYLPLNALHAADMLIIPLQCEYYALEGLSQILGTLQEIEKASIDYRILLTMYDEGSQLSQDVMSEVKQHFPHNHFQNAIPRDENLASAPSHSQCGFELNPFSPGALAYLAVTKEIIHAFE